MSITGKIPLRAHFEAAKARKAQIESRASAAVDSYNSAATLAESAIQKLEADAAELQAEVAQLTNGGPALDDAPASVTPVPSVRGYPQ